MKQSINFCEFENQFISIRPNSFSYEGLRALFDHLEMLEEDSGIEEEFNVIDLCGYYSEDSIKNSLEYYGLEDIEELKENTTVIEVDEDTIIYAAY